MIMNIKIRFATENDLPGILAIYNDAILNTTAVYNYHAHTLEMRREWLAEKLAKNHPVFVAEENGTIAGFASYGAFRQWAAYKYAMEHSVYVHQDFRGKGIAGSLLTQLIDEAKKRDVHVLIGGIDADNTISIQLHKNLGFAECGYIKQVGYKFGRWLDLIFMQLILDTPEAPKEG
jgi:L-amino acid N-acyltransferase